MENRHSEARGQPADVVIRRPEMETTGQGPISVTQGGNMESRGLNGTGQGPKGHEATGQGPISVTQDGNSESRGLNSTGQGPKGHEATGQGPISEGCNRIGQGPKDGVEQPVTTATESKDDCRDTHKVTGQGPSSINIGGNRESRGLYIAGQGPASTTNEGDLVVSDESDETTVAIDRVKSRVLNTVAVERDDGIKRAHSGQITLLKEVPTWKERCLGEALEWHGGLAEKIALWRGDITALQVDAVVNAAKSSLLGGGGVDGAIHRVAGPGLRDECATLNGCSVGEAKITGAHGLPAKHVIHTVDPRSGDEELIHCYQSCFSICAERNLQTIAFPCISTGHFGFPKEQAAHLAVGTVKEILATGSPNIERVIFCVFTADDVEIYERVLHEYFPVDPVSEGEPVARRGVPYISGVYIEGMVQGIEANCTVDTGATITMMSRDVYERIPETNRPPLNKCSSPATADGRLMKAYGSAVFEIDLGPLMLDKTIAVAELADEVLLGADIRQFDPGGPADLILSQGVMVLRGKSIPVLQIGSRTMVRKVRSADHYALPPMTEMIVDAFVDRQEDSHGPCKKCLKGVELMKSDLKNGKQ